MHLTITLLAKSKNNMEPFFIVSTQGNQQNYWVGLVANVK